MCRVLYTLLPLEYLTQAFFCNVLVLLCLKRASIFRKFRSHVNRCLFVNVSVLISCDFKTFSHNSFADFDHTSTDVFFVNVSVLISCDFKTSSNSFANVDHTSTDVFFVNVSVLISCHVKRSHFILSQILIDGQPYLSSADVFVTVNNTRFSAKQGGLNVRSSTSVSEISRGFLEKKKWYFCLTCDLSFFLKKKQKTN